MNAALFMDDPDWADFIPELKSSGEKRGMPTHEDCSSLEVDLVASHLLPGGVLGRMPNYEIRTGQVDMLRAVVRAFNECRHLMIEAGTGTGKSLAYLIPAVQWAWLNDTPVIVSTATRNLQSQLINADIPRAISTLPSEANDKFRVALLKGRGNYVCLRELADAMAHGYYSYSVEERNEWDKFVDWLHAAPEGDLDSFCGTLLRSRITCLGDDCSGRRCPFWAKCFVTKARDHASRAHLVVANHSLVLSEAVEGASSVLPAYGRIIFDEAHNLEDIATDFFSFEFSRELFRQVLGRVERGKNNRRGKRGALPSVENQLRKGALASTTKASEISELLRKIRVAAAFAVGAVDDVHSAVGALFSPSPDSDRIRYRIPASNGQTPVPPVRQYSLHGLFADYTPAQWDESKLTAAVNSCEEKLARVVNGLAKLAEALDSTAEEGELSLFGDLSTQVRSAADGIRAFVQEMKFVFAGSDTSYVYWIERRRNPHREVESRLIAAPLSVAEKMHRYFFANKDSVVLCSATLRVGDRFDYTAKRLGVTWASEHGDDSRTTFLVAASPFDYLRQSLTLAADFLADPSQGAEEYSKSVAPLLARIFEVVGGRGLVLFTSYEMMHAVEMKTRPLFDNAGIELLVQGGTLSREAMTDRLRNASVDHPVVLFGAQSFWEGVDIPGAALSCVVMARLPFPQVGDPITEARGEAVETAGGSAFRDYLLPEAVIRFRQGFGRLVRGKSDFGVVLVADNRIIAKNYGAVFRHSIPSSTHTVHSLDETVVRVKEFFSSLI